jgi:DNA methylase
MTIPARWEVIGGDCAGVLPALRSGSIAHAIMDPPYSARTHDSVRRGGARSLPLADGNGKMTAAAYGRKTDLGFGHLSPTLRRVVARECARLAQRWVLVFSDTESDWLWRLSMAAAGLPHIRTLIWDRIGGAPQFTGDRPAAAYEAITLAHRPGRKRWNGGGRRGMYSFPIVANRSGHRSDRVHTTQKPVELMMALVSDFTDPDEIVLDPFCGSGTTGVACLRLGRRFVGIEKDPKWAALARERLTAEEQNSTLHEQRAGQLPLLGGIG